MSTHMSKQQQEQDSAGVPITGTLVSYGHGWRNVATVAGYSDDFARVCLNAGGRLVWWTTAKIRMV